MNYKKKSEFHLYDEDETDLHRAVRTKDVDIVKLTLENGGDILVNILNGKSRSPVHVAIEEELESIVQLFLSTVKDSMAEDQCYLHFAIAKGNINIVKLLAEHFPLQTRNQKNMTVFCVAINEDKFEILDYLLSLPSSINTNSNIYEYSALFYIAIIAGNIEIVKTYLASKFPINTPLQSNADGWEILNQHASFSPLHLAVKFLRLNIVELLLDQGADIMKQNGAGSSAHQIAFETKTRGVWKTWKDIEINDQIIDRLLNDIIKKEAFTLTNSNSTSLIYAACSRDKPEVIEKCLQKKYITMEYLEKCDKQGSTPLHYAANYKCPKVAKILLQYNPVNVNQRDDEYCTPLYIASKEESLECVQILMQYKADPNLTDFFGNTPIHLAFNTRNYAILDLLLTNETTINPNLTDAAGISHFHIACTRNNVNLVRAFIDAGTPVDLQVPIDLTIPIEYPKLKRKQDLDWPDCMPLDLADSPLDLQVPINFTIPYELRVPIELTIPFEYPKHKRKKDLDWRGCVPLHFATVFNRVKIVELLLIRGADFCKQDAKGFYPIHTACQQNYDRFGELIKQSLQNMDQTLEGPSIFLKKRSCSDKCYVEEEMKAKQTYSHPRESQSSSSLVDLLKTKATNIFEWIPNRNEQIEMIKLLSKNGADLNVSDNYGNAPLFYIYDFNIHRILYILHERLHLDGNLDTVIKRCFLVEMYARRLRILEEIFKLGVPINIDRCYSNDSSILHYICQKNEFDDMEKVEMMKYFLEKNANVNAQRTDGMTPLHNLSCNCFYEVQEMSRILLKYNARVNLRNHEGKTPLFMACGSNNISLTKRLLYHGADLNLEDRDRQTPFCYYFELYGGTEPSRETLKFIATILIYTCKLKSLGVYVSDKVQRSGFKLHRLSQSNRDFILNDDQRATIKQQIDILKNIDINGAISVYDVLSMNEHNVSRNIIIEHLYKTLYSTALSSHPDFGYLRIIYHKYKLAVVRKRLLPKAKQTLNRVFSTTRFPEVCSEFIFTWLSNEELADFVEAFSHLTSFQIKHDKQRIKAFLKIRKTIVKHVGPPGNENELEIDLITDLIMKSR